MTTTWFQHDERLGIALPWLEREWAEYSEHDRHTILMEWERIRARIPDRIRQVEEEIEVRQLKASHEDCWDTVCRLYTEISLLASVINDLNIWMRVEQSFHVEDEWHNGIAEEHRTREK